MAMSLLLWKAVLCYSRVKVLIPQKPGTVAGADMQSGTGHSLFPHVLWLLPQSPCREAGAPTVRHCCPRPAWLNSCSSEVSHLWSLHLLFAVAKPLSHPAPSLRLQGAEPPSLLPSLHSQAHDGETRFSGRREDDGTTGKVERQASEPSLPPAAHRIRNYFSSIGNQVTSTWK